MVLFLRAAFIGLTMATTMAVAHSEAAEFPNRPIRIVIGFGAGVGLDVNTRFMAEMLEKDLGQSVTIENKPGASGMIAANTVRSAPKDGYTLLVINNQHYTNKIIYKNISYSDDDFIPISGGGFSTMTLATSKELPVNSVKELIEFGKQKPNNLRYAYWGTGGSPQILAKKMEEISKMQMLGVAYKDSGPANADLVAGRVSLFFTSLAQALPLYDGKQVNLLAISAPQRLPNLPDVPTFTESGLIGMPNPWWGYAAPAGTPRDVVEKLHRAILKVVSSAEFREKLARSGSTPMPTETPEKLVEFVKQDFMRWEPIIRGLDIRIE